MNATHTRTIAHVRAYTVTGGGADYHDQGADHWIDDHIATPVAAVLRPERAGHADGRDRGR